MSVAPEWFVLQTSDMELRQVSRGLVSGGGPWWHAKFSSTSNFVLKPLRQHNDMPVFGVDMPAAVLDVMLEMMQVRELVEDYWRHLPLRLVGKMTLKTWRGYMRAYGLSETEELDEEPAAKHQRTMSPYDMRTERVAEALCKNILAEHPRAPAFLSGQLRILRCHFVARFGAVYPEGGYAPPSYIWKHPDLTQPDDSTIAFFLMETLDEKQREILVDTFKRNLPPNVEVFVQYTHKHDQNSGAKIKPTFSHWPLSPDDTAPVAVTKQAHDVVLVAFQY